VVVFFSMDSGLGLNPSRAGTAGGRRKAGAEVQHGDTNFDTTHWETRGAGCFDPAKSNAWHRLAPKNRMLMLAIEISVLPAGPRIGSNASRTRLKADLSPSQHSALYATEPTPVRLRKTQGGGRVFSFAKRSKSKDFGPRDDGIYLTKSYGYVSLVRCMGCKGSSVRITPSRPYISMT